MVRQWQEEQPLFRGFDGEEYFWMLGESLYESKSRNVLLQKPGKFWPTEKVIMFQRKRYYWQFWKKKKKKNPNPLDQVIKNCDTLSDPWENRNDFKNVKNDTKGQRLAEGAGKESEGQRGYRISPSSIIGRWRFPRIQFTWYSDQTWSAHEDPF